MKKYIAKAILGVALAAFVTGCTSVQRNAPHSQFGATYFEAKLDRSDFEVIGPVEGTSSLTSILFGLIRIIDKDKVQILGIKFFEDQYCYTPQSWSDQLRVALTTSVEDRAYYQALAATPDADVVWSKSYKITCSGLPFLYRTKEATYTGKAVKIKTNK